MSREIIERVTFTTEDRPIKGFALDQAVYIVDTKQEVLDAQAISNERVAKLVVWARDIAKFMVFNEDGSTFEEREQPTGDAYPYRDAEPLDHVESVGFDENKKARIDNPGDQRYMFVDLPTRLYNTGEVDIYLDSSKPIGAIQLENFCNYNWDYPELIIKLYVDNNQTYLGGFRIPYGFGVLMKYNLDNKSESNLSKGWWTWHMFGVDWSVINKVASIDGEFSSVAVAYNGLFGDEGESDERVFYPAMLKQDVNGWTQFEFTANAQFKSKNKDSGVVGDKVFELQPSKVVHHKQPYYGDNKLATKTTHHLDVTTSLNDVKHSSGKSMSQWVTDNPGYEPKDFLGAIMDSTVLGNTSFVLFITTSGNDYNGTFPTSYQEVEIHRTGGSARNFMRAYNKESHTHYFAPYKPNQNPAWKTYTYAEDVPDIVDAEVQPLEERITNLETGGNLDTNFVQSEFKFANAPADGYTQSVADHETQRMIIRNQVVDVVKVPEETKGALAFAITFNDSGRFWMGFHADLVGEIVGFELMNKRPNLGIVFDTSKFNPCLKQGDSTPITGIMNWEGVCIPTGMDANDDSPARYIMPDGSQTTVKADAFTREYMDWNLNQRDTYVDANDFVEDWKFRLSRGYIAENGVFIPDESSPYYFCRMGMQYSYSVSKVSTVSFVGGTFSIYQTPAGAIADREKVATTAEVAEMISGNNDEILTPENGSDFELVDSSFEAGYGLNGNVTYIGISKTEGQSTVLVNHLDQSKCYFIHKAHNTTSGFMMLHESLVAEIYNKDLTDVNELVMLFGPKSKGRLGKLNQKAPEGYIWNWNGEAVPDTVSANEINPGNWLDKDGNPTTTWSSSVMSACFSVGTLTNVGSAALVRGDVIFDEATTTTSMTVSNDSEFFVMPVKTGGGTFSDIKLFQLFMGRRSGTQNDFDAYTFDKSADAIGTLLRISYDAAVQVEEVSKSEQETQLLAGMAGGQLFVNEIQAG